MVKQNLKVIENKKVLITSKLKKKFIEILFQKELNLKPSFFHLKIKFLALSGVNFAV